MKYESLKGLIFAFTTQLKTNLEIDLKTSTNFLFERPMEGQVYINMFEADRLGGSYNHLESELEEALQAVI